MPSTHPIAADNYDLQAVEVNFDMITYAKGAAVLKQLVAWVGLEPFLAGLRQYFKDFAYGNSEFSDLLLALEKSSGRELQGWAQEWLQTAGVNTLAPAFELDDDGQPTPRSRSCRPPTPTGRRCAGTGSASASTTRSPTRTCAATLVRRSRRRDRRRRRTHRDPRARRRAAARPAAAQRRATSPTPRSGSTSAPWRPCVDDLSTRRGLPRPGAVLGRRVGHDPRRRDARDRLRRPGAGQHRPGDRRLGHQPDPGVRRPGGELVLRPGQPPDAAGDLGARAAHAARGGGAGQRPAAHLPARPTRRPRAPTRRSPTSRRCSTATLAFDGPRDRPGPALGR